MAKNVQNKTKYYYAIRDATWVHIFIIIICIYTVEPVLYAWIWNHYKDLTVYSNNTYVRRIIINILKMLITFSNIRSIKYKIVINSVKYVIKLMVKEIKTKIISL